VIFVQGGRDGVTACRAYFGGQSRPPDQPPPSTPPKPKLTAEERRARQADQLMRIRHQVVIGRDLDERGITTPAEVGEALGMVPAEAMALLSRHQWREGDVALLKAAAARLRLQVPDLGPWRP
jgi:hypothetical protein